MADLPIVCTLTPDTIRTRRAGLLPGLAERAARREPLDNGYRLRFDPSADLLTAMAASIAAERQCCRFLTFRIVVQPDEGEISLDITGPAGTRDFLDALLSGR
jgi:hypothetical protein